MYILFFYSVHFMDVLYHEMNSVRLLILKMKKYWKRKKKHVYPIGKIHSCSETYRYLHLVVLTCKPFISVDNFIVGVASNWSWSYNTQKRKQNEKEKSIEFGRYKKRKGYSPYSTRKKSVQKVRLNIIVQIVLLLLCVTMFEYKIQKE